MKTDEEVFRQIAESMSGHFECVYYVDLESGEFIEYACKESYEKFLAPKHGDDFFSTSQENIRLYVHPDDINRVLPIFDRDSLTKALSRHSQVSLIYRLIYQGQMIRIRCIWLLTADQKHVICCLEDIEAETKKEEENSRKLQSARRMARRDELTGVRNKNAYQEYADSIETNRKIGPKDYSFGVVVCDINDLKAINDTRGHNFGDEAIQRASRMICETFSHSPVFRIGGDEFVVVLSGRDFDERETLVGKLKGISIANGRDRSGPVVACGMSVYDQKTDESYSEIFAQADQRMYEDKTKLKTMKLRDGYRRMGSEKNPITDERKRLLDGMFGAMYTIAGGGYVFLTDMRHDFTRWSLPLVDDFAMPSEYMYHARDTWKERIHPEDLSSYDEAINAVFREDAAPDFHRITYRARLEDGTYIVCSPRGFVLNDSEGEPEYFGGIIIPE